MFKNGLYVKGEKKLVVQLGNEWIELKYAIKNSIAKNNKLPLTRTQDMA